MNIAYVQPQLRLPNKKAHTIQMVTTCEGLARLGYDVDMWLHDWSNRLYQYYGIERLSNLRFRQFNNRFFDEYADAGAVAVITRDAREAKRLIRDTAGRKIKIVYETHQNVDLRELQLDRENPVQLQVIDYQRMKDRGWSEQAMTFFMTRAHGIICINESYMKERLSKSEVPITAVWYGADGCKRAANIDGNQQIHLGHLYRHKGVPILLRALQRVRSGLKVCFLGGLGPDVTNARRITSELGVSDKVRWLEHVPYGQVKHLLGSFGVGIALNRGLKLCDYIAAEMAIIAPNLASIRDIFCHEKNALLYKPYCVDSLASCMDEICYNQALLSRIQAGVSELKDSYSILGRAQSIANFLENSVIGHQHVE